MKPMYCVTETGDMLVTHVPEDPGIHLQVGSSEPGGSEIRPVNFEAGTYRTADGAEHAIPDRWYEVERGDHGVFLIVRNRAGFTVGAYPFRPAAPEELR